MAKLIAVRHCAYRVYELVLLILLKQNDYNSCVTLLNTGFLLQHVFVIKFYSLNVIALGVDSTNAVVVG